MVVQLIQNLVWIFPNGSTANTKPCLDTSKWWINGPSKTIWMDLNGSTACYQHCSNGITMCVQNQWAFLKVEILNGFKWSFSRRVRKCLKLEYPTSGASLLCVFTVRKLKGRYNYVGSVSKIASMSMLVYCNNPHILSQFASGLTDPPEPFVC